VEIVLDVGTYPPIPILAIAESTYPLVAA